MTINPVSDVTQQQNWRSLLMKLLNQYNQYNQKGNSTYRWSLNHIPNLHTKGNIYTRSGKFGGRMATGALSPLLHC